MVTIEPRQNCEAPLGVGHGTPVKIQVRVREHWGNLVMLYGVVSVCEEDRWNIFIQNAVACTESRRAFRQRVEAEAEILWGPGFRFRGKCQLEDISLVGVAFYSPLKLDVGRQLILSIPCLTGKRFPAINLPVRWQVLGTLRSQASLLAGGMAALLIRWTKSRRFTL